MTQEQMEKAKSITNYRAFLLEHKKHMEKVKNNLVKEEELYVDGSSYVSIGAGDRGYTFSFYAESDALIMLDPALMPIKQSDYIELYILRLDKMIKEKEEEFAKL